MKNIKNTIVSAGLAFLALCTSQAYSQDFEAIQEKEPYFILSIHGGGIRGLIPATILARLEADLGFKCGDMFDCIAGTSTGGIIAVGLSVPHPSNPSVPAHSASDLVDIYLKHGSSIFSNTWSYKVRTMWGLVGPKYDNSSLIEELRKELGEATLDQSLTDLVIPSYDMSTGKAFVFKHFKNCKNGATDHYKDYEVALAGSAAPTFFSPEALRDFGNPAIVHNLVDGGLVANNPAELAFRECIKHAELQGREVYILSLGTGKIATTPILAEESQSWGAIQFALPVIQSIFDASNMTVDEDMKALSRHTNVHFFNIDVPISAEHGNMDDITESNLNYLHEAANVSYDAHFFKGSKIDTHLIHALKEKMKKSSRI